MYKIIKHKKENEEDKVLHFKISKHCGIEKGIHAKLPEEQDILFKFKTDESSEYMYKWIENKHFNKVIDLITYFMDNQDSQYLKVKVVKV